MMRAEMIIPLLPFIFALIAGCSGLKPSASDDILERMKIHVSPEENRPVSFTNKEATYYYTQTHKNDHPEWSHFTGLNIAKKKIFSGYELYLNTDRIINTDADVWVYPYKLTRKHHPGLCEEVQMFDYENVLEVSLTGAREPIGIGLTGERVKLLDSNSKTAWFSANEGDYIIAVSPVHQTPIRVENGKVITSPKGQGFYITIAASPENAVNMISTVRASEQQLKEQQKFRMQKLLRENAFLETDDQEFQLAMNWITLTLDQLVTRQHGDGIYAGLPWFNEYWGRDQFISLPGACLVSGRFETAARILTAFAEYQETDPGSEFFGRVPNIVNPQNIDYHTTDGTPRFVIQLQEYVRYSGDTTLIQKLYPKVQNSIEGALKNWTDDIGYLLHADNETWMDARRHTDLMPYSPRGSRANDIQALWYQQLQAGVYFAEMMNDPFHQQRWQHVADRVKHNFERDFRNGSHDYLADRLDAKDIPDFQLRPNQLFALELISDIPFRWQVTRKCWEELVYPWGVASLNRQDPFFHPFHTAWEHYHKDEAYHNGTVWLWNNGIAMQRMIEAEQPETAWLLFRNMNHQALNHGVVGGLGENMDAYPHEGEDWPRLTGTYLQAWSSAEHLRVWYQYFLGIRPDMLHHFLTLAPRIPEEINSLTYKFHIGNGTVEAVYSKNDPYPYRYTFQDISLTTEVDIFPYEPCHVAVSSRQTLLFGTSEAGLKISIQDSSGMVINTKSIEKDPIRLKHKSKLQTIFKEIEFCQPFPEDRHPVLQKTYQQN